MILIFTACVTPQIEKNLMVDNCELRAHQYMRALEFYIRCDNIDKIVVCDNSGYNFECNRLNKLSKEYKKQIEYLYFYANNYECKKRGKGYGEGEILKYVIDYSELLKNEKIFIKVTGRLIVSNIDRIIKTVKNNYSYFNGMGILGKSSQLDTRFFIVQKDVYCKFFLKLFLNVDDSKHIFLEHVFMKCYLDNKFLVRSTKFYPAYVGISGTTGKDYKLPRCKQLLKDVGAYFFDIYNPKKKG